MKGPLNLSVLDTLRGVGFVVLLAGALMLVGWLLSGLAALITADS